MLTTLSTKINCTTYEIWDAKTQEILVDGLTFEDAAVQYLTYQEFFGEDIFVAERKESKMIRHTNAAQEFKKAWVNYFEELYALGNLG